LPTTTRQILLVQSHREFQRVTFVPRMHELSFYERAFFRLRIATDTEAVPKVRLVLGWL